MSSYLNQILKHQKKNKSLLYRPLPKEDKLIAQADIAVAYATKIRKQYRRRTQKGERGREEAIGKALRKLRKAMDPIRSTKVKRAVRRLPPSPALDKAAKELQAQRMKLFKMRLKHSAKM